MLWQCAVLVSGEVVTWVAFSTAMGTAWSYVTGTLLSTELNAFKFLSTLLPVVPTAFSVLHGRDVFLLKRTWLLSTACRKAGFCDCPQSICCRISRKWPMRGATNIVGVPSTRGIRKKRCANSPGRGTGPRCCPGGSPSAHVSAGRFPVKGVLANKDTQRDRVLR